MDNSTSIGRFPKSLLAGFLTGVIAAIINLGYVIAYRDISGFAKAEAVMPISIFLGFPILLALFGGAFYLMQKLLGNGTRWFVLFCLVLAASLVWMTAVTASGQSGSFFSGVRGLLIGMEAVTLILAATMIPYFAAHPKIYS